MRATATPAPSLPFIEASYRRLEISSWRRRRRRRRRRWLIYIGVRGTIKLLSKIWVFKEICLLHGRKHNLNPWWGKPQNFWQNFWFWKKFACDMEGNIIWTPDNWRVDSRVFWGGGSPGTNLNNRGWLACPHFSKMLGGQVNCKSEYWG